MDDVIITIFPQASLLVVLNSCSFLQSWNQDCKMPFSKYNKIVGKFLWNNKTTRIKRITLVPIEKGGLGLKGGHNSIFRRPNFHWFKRKDCVIWTQIERDTLKIEDSSFVPYCFTYKYIKITENPIIVYSIKKWEEINRYLSTWEMINPCPHLP